MGVREQRLCDPARGPSAHAPRWSVAGCVAAQHPRRARYLRRCSTTLATAGGGGGGGAGAELVVGGGGSRDRAVDSTWPRPCSASLRIESISEGVECCNGCFCACTATSTSAAASRCAGKRGSSREMSLAQSRTDGHGPASRHAQKGQQGVRARRAPGRDPRRSPVAASSMVWKAAAASAEPSGDLIMVS